MVRFSPLVAATFGAVLFLLSPLESQSAAEGYVRTTQSLPGSANSITVVDDGNVWFDGVSLNYDAPGLPTRALLTFPTFRFGSFTMAIGNGELLFAESSYGQIWRVPVDAARTPQLLNTIQYAYDAVAIGPGVAIVSAKTGGFSSAQNDLIALDLVTGAQTTIGLVPGASGPLALSPEQELVYATAPLTFPPPPAAVDVIRWNAAQWSLALSGGPVLTNANAQVIVNGLDSAGDLAIDIDDDIFVADYGNARVLEISDSHTTKSVSTILDFALASTSPSALAFLPGATRNAEFEPFAHQGGGVLCVIETDYFATTNVARLAARSAPLALAGGSGPVAPGVFTLMQQNGPHAGFCMLALGTVGTGALLPLRLQGFEQALLWEAGLLFPVATLFAPLDPTGTAAFALSNPGFPNGLWIHCQTAFVAADGSSIGASNVCSVALQ